MRGVVLPLAVSFLVSRYIGRDWMPQEDQKELGVQLELPEGSSVEETERVTMELARRLEKIPGVRALNPSSSYGFVSRVNTAQIFVLLAPEGERASILEMGRLVRAEAANYAYARPRITFPNVLGGHDTFSPIRAQLLGPDIQRSVEFARQIMLGMMQEPSLTDVKANLNLNDPEFQVAIDRQLASDLRWRVADISGAVRLLMSGDDQISTFKEGPEQYPVTMRLLPGQPGDPSVLSRLLVRSARLGLIRLDSVAKI